jgi:hypothetical protein
MELILESGRAEKNYWRDLWRYRELFIILAWRDIAVRYKQTVIGVAWAVNCRCQSMNSPFPCSAHLSSVRAASSISARWKKLLQM